MRGFRRFVCFCEDVGCSRGTGGLYGNDRSCRGCSTVVLRADGRMLESQANSPQEATLHKGVSPARRARPVWSHRAAFFNPSLRVAHRNVTGLFTWPVAWVYFETFSLNQSITPTAVGIAPPEKRPCTGDPVGLVVAARNQEDGRSTCCSRDGGC